MVWGHAESLHHRTSPDKGVLHVPKMFHLILCECNAVKHTLCELGFGVQATFSKKHNLDATFIACF